MEGRCSLLCHDGDVYVLAGVNVMIVFPPLRVGTPVKKKKIGRDGGVNYLQPGGQPWRNV